MDRAVKAVTDAMWQEVLLHWERLVLNPWTDKPTVTRCCFCLHYEPNSNNWCHGCPIMADTGYRCCTDTPYEAAYNTWEDIIDWKTGCEYTPQRQLSIWREYRYLTGLYRRWKRDQEG